MIKNCLFLFPSLGFGPNPFNDFVVGAELTNQLAGIYRADTGNPVMILISPSPLASTAVTRCPKMGLESP